MSYWSSGYNSLLGSGIRNGAQEHEAELPLSNSSAKAAQDFDLSDISAEAKLFTSTSFTGWTTSLQKRAFDTLIAAPALLLSLPLMGMVAVLIKCSSSGPVLFRQERVGLGQKPFTIYKFRTMHAQRQQDGPGVTRKGDDRLTRVGKVLRKLKLDEIPQLYNVLRGDMSLVGPRPKLADHEQMYLFCRPGITGAATLVFAREEELLSSVPHDEVENYAIRVLNPIKAKLDMEYANSATLRSDLRLLVDTIFRLGRRESLHSMPEFAEVADTTSSHEA